MPRYNDETKESIQSVDMKIGELISDPVKKFEFISQIEAVLSKGRDGAVHFKPHLIFARRTAVMHLFTGENMEEVAKTLGISTEIVRKDIRACYEDPSQATTPK